MALTELGYRVGVFKPVAGHDMWSQYPVFKKSRKLGFLLGEDVSLYSEYLGIGDILAVNPVDLLLSPLNPDKYVAERNIRRYLEELSNPLLQIVMARVHKCSSGETTHFLIEDNAVKAPPALRKELEEFASETGATRTNVEKILELLSNKSIDDELDYCLNKISKDKEFVLIESFNNALIPYMGLRDKIDELIVVAPGAAIIYPSNQSPWRKEYVELVEKREGLATGSEFVEKTPGRVYHIAPRDKPGSRDADILNLAVEIAGREKDNQS